MKDIRYQEAYIQNSLYFCREVFLSLTYYILIMNKSYSLDYQQTCPDHSFSLTPLKTSCYFQKKITADFCNNQVNVSSRSRSKTKKNNLNPRGYEDTHTRSVNLPTFNKDRNYGSPGFTLASEKVRISFMDRCILSKTTYEYCMIIKGMPSL